MSRVEQVSGECQVANGVRRHDERPVDPEQQQAWFRSMWESTPTREKEEKEAVDAQQPQHEAEELDQGDGEDAGNGDGFGDDFDDFNEGGGDDDDFGDFDEAEEADTSVVKEPPVQPAQPAAPPDILAGLVSSQAVHFAHHTLLPLHLFRFSRVPTDHIHSSHHSISPASPNPRSSPPCKAT